MKLDTSSYYPESPLGPENDEDYMPKPQGAPKADSIEEVKRIIEESGESPLRPEPKGENRDAATSDGAPSAPKGSGKKQELKDDLPDGERVANALSNLVSWIFVPLLMPVYGILIAFNLSILDFTPFRSKLVFTLITAAFTVLVPMLAIFLLKRLGLVDDLGLNNRKERFIPYLVMILCIGGTGVFMWYKHAPMWLAMFFAGGALAAVINMIVNFRWKISAHAAGVAGIVALIVRIIHDGFPQEGIVGWLIAWIIIGGAVGSARVWLGRHTVLQVLAGYLVGFLCVFLLTMIR